MKNIPKNYTFPKDQFPYIICDVDPTLLSNVCPTYL